MILDQPDASLDRLEMILDQPNALLDRLEMILDHHNASLDRHKALLDQHVTIIAVGMARILWGKRPFYATVLRKQKSQQIVGFFSGI